MHCVHPWFLYQDPVYEYTLIIALLQGASPQLMGTLNLALFYETFYKIHLNIAFGLTSRSQLLKTLM